MNFVYFFYLNIGTIIRRRKVGTNPRPKHLKRYIGTRSKYRAHFFYFRICVGTLIEAQGKPGRLHISTFWVNEKI